MAPSDVWLQSFVEQDVMYWLAASPAGFGPQAVMLDNNYTDGTAGGLIASFDRLSSAGVKILAPPMQMLVKVLDGLRPLFSPVPFMESAPPPVRTAGGGRRVPPVKLRDGGQSQGLRADHLDARAVGSARVGRRLVRCVRSPLIEYNKEATHPPRYNHALSCAYLRTGTTAPRTTTPWWTATCSTSRTRHEACTDDEHRGAMRNPQAVGKRCDNIPSELVTRGQPDIFSQLRYRLKSRRVAHGGSAAPAGRLRGFPEVIIGATDREMSRPTALMHQTHG